jgi:CelD/BcsL family acetyltransferase involved in cellulose biosynthesis
MSMQAVNLAPSPAEPLAQPARWLIRRHTSLAELGAMQPAWQELAAHALEPNAFYEPWMMLPALKLFPRRRALEVWSVHLDTGNGPRLVGLFPFERRWHFPRLGIRHLRSLRYHYCSLCTPLVDARLAAPVVHELLRVLRGAGGLVEFRLLTDGPVAAHLKQWLARRRIGTQLRRFNRAAFAPHATPAAYLAATFSASERSNLRRRERRLREQGELRFESLAADEPIAPWVDRFLKLEASGWKGRRGSALAIVPAGEEYFRQLCMAAHAQGRLRMHALTLDGRVLAQLCLLAADCGLYGFRMTYDEAYARYSPGVLLSVWHTRRLHDQPHVQWADSCSDPDSALMNRIWRGRRPLLDLSASFGTMGAVLAGFDRLLARTGTRA